jgi:iron complex transport system permease protein
LTSNRRLMRVYLALLGLLLIVALLGLLTGSGGLADPRLLPIYLQLRATRLCAALLVGAALGVGGAIVQGLFRNPLADPSILGTTAGAHLGGRIVMLLLPSLAGAAGSRAIAPELLLPLGCFAGACAALAIVLVALRRDDDSVVVLLTGFLLSSLFISLGGFVTSLAMERWELARAMLDFALGDLSGVGMRRVLLALPLVGGGLIAAYCWARPLDLLLSGEEEAQALGVDVREVRRACVLWTAVLTAAAVSIGGSVGFVGLIVPHALRPWVGAGHRALVPASALLGAAFVAGCDVLTRVMPTRSEIPLGVITGLFGAPLFLLLLRRSRSEVTRD